MKQKLSFIIVCLGFVFAHAQQQTLPVKAQEVAEWFQKPADTISWAFPVSDTASVSLKWVEKKVSFKIEGVQIFSGYDKKGFRALLKVRKANISGTLFGENAHDTKIETTPAGFLQIQTQEIPKNECETAFLSSETNHHHHETEPIASAFTTEEEKGFSDNVLRIYRLAIPISYSYFSNKFKGDTTQAQVFWAEMEVGLNEIYMRDLSVKFKIVNDTRLIEKNTSEKYRFTGSSMVASNIIQQSTSKINQVISKNDYDIGIVVTKNDKLKEDRDGNILGGLLGLAELGSGYIPERKANALGVPELRTLAHEIGHLFGANHTFTEGGTGTLKTEPDVGTSLMSYGKPMDFFSLVSINQIKKILSRMPYYSDEGRTQLVGDKRPFAYNRDNSRFYTNATYAIRTSNQSPVLDRDALKTSYVLPKNTFFEFRLKAEDPEKRPLYYMAHQADIISTSNSSQRSNARFLTRPAEQNSTIRFQKEYRITDTYAPGAEMITEKPYTSSPVGKYTFWLGVRDSDLSDNYIERNNYATEYDVFETSLNIVEGKPFVFTNSFEKKYKVGQKITLKWDVDPNVFPKDSRVKLFLSTDFGKTFPIELTETENDGECEIVLPQEVGKTEFSVGNIKQNIPAGVIKLQHVGGIAYALSATKPFSIKRDYRGGLTGAILGGFEVEASEIRFTMPPQKEVSLKCDELTLSEAQKKLVRAESSCTIGSVRLEVVDEGKQKDCRSYTFTRWWRATDGCGNETYFQQLVHVVPSTNLHFVGNLPAHQTLSCDAFARMAVPNVVAKGGCGNVNVTYSDRKEPRHCENSFVLVRTWTATDKCENQIHHKQLITVVDDTAPVFSGTLPKDIALSEEEFKHFTPATLSATDNCSPQVKVIRTQQELTPPKGFQKAIRYTWSASDACGNRTQHSQTVRVITQPTFFNAVSTENGSENVFYIHNIEFFKNRHLQIFDQMGLKVFENKDYDNVNDVFRGIANTARIIGKGEKLPAGVYFFIFTYESYNGEPFSRSGFIYVK